MRPKLFTKSEVALGKSKDRQLEIQEGKKLALKVDTLRELASQEESNLLKFRTESLARIKEDIDREVSKKYELIKENAELETKRVELLQPLDEKWEVVLQKEADVDFIKETVVKKRDELNSHIALLKKKHIQQDKLLKQIKDNDEEIQLAFDRVIYLQSQADKTLSERLDEKVKQEKDFAERETDLFNRQNSITVYEKTLKLRSENLDARESELHNYKVKLDDERGTLERAFKRLHEPTKRNNTKGR